MGSGSFCTLQARCWLGKVTSKYCLGSCNCRLSAGLANLPACPCPTLADSCAGGRHGERQPGGGCPQPVFTLAPPALGGMHVPGNRLLQQCPCWMQRPRALISRRCTATE